MFGWEVTRLHILHTWFDIQIKLKATHVARKMLLLRITDSDFLNIFHWDYNTIDDDFMVIFSFLELFLFVSTF